MLFNYTPLIWDDLLLVSAKVENAASAYKPIIKAFFVEDTWEMRIRLLADTN